MIGGADQAGAVIGRIRGFLKKVRRVENGAPSRAGDCDVLVFLQPEVMKRIICRRCWVSDPDDARSARSAAALVAIEFDRAYADRAQRRSRGDLSVRLIASDSALIGLGPR